MSQAIYTAACIGGPKDGELFEFTTDPFAIPQFKCYDGFYTLKLDSKRWYWYWEN